MERFETTREVRVWDPLLRIFHWTLAAAFFTAYFTGDDLERVHELAGYLILGLLAFRIPWGFVGPRHARFTDFVRGPRAVRVYLKSLLSTRPQHHLGHNPAGGWMVLALLLMLGLACWTGLEALAVEGRGPLASLDASPVASAYANGREHGERGERESGEDDEFWEDVHEALAEIGLALVLVHIAGVLVTSMVHRENLARAMVTGRKRLRPDSQDADPAG